MSGIGRLTRTGRFTLVSHTVVPAQQQKEPPDLHESGSRHRSKKKKKALDPDSIGLWIPTRSGTTAHARKF
jgi:hypothetical protein